MAANDNLAMPCLDAFFATAKAHSGLVQRPVDGKAPISQYVKRDIGGGETEFIPLQVLSGPGA